MAEQEYLTVREAASLLGLSSATLRNWDKAGKLRAVRHPVNGYRLYRLGEVVALQGQQLLFPTVAIEEEPQPVQVASLTSTELRRLIKRLHRMLRDGEGNSSLIERFDELTKLLYLKVCDEKANGNASPFVSMKGDTDEKIALRASKAFEALVRTNLNLFPQRFRKLRLGTAALREAVSALEPIRLYGAVEDLKGLAYEEVIRNTFEKGDNQQFFTPRTVVEFMIDMLGDSVSGTVCDPACGTGGFLLQVGMNGKRFPSRRTKLIGFEIDERLAWVTNINLAMHGLTDFAVECLPGAGSLGIDARAHFGSVDVVLTNPPFGSDLSDDAALKSFSLGQGRSSRRRGVLFIERCLELVKPGGIVAIVIDEGVLNAPSNRDTRKLILETAEPIAIVSLPETAFMPYASVKASILFLRKRSGRRKTTGQTFFAEAEVVGRKPNGDPLLRVNKSTRKLELDSDLPNIVEAWRRGRDDEGSNNAPRCFWAELPSIGDSDYESDGWRLDAAYHHPSRHKAITGLRNSTYPLRSLADICSIRNDSVIPARQMSDEEITYVGLANIEAETGAMSPSIVGGASLKSSVKRFFGGDILYAKMRPELRKVCLVPDDLAEGFTSAECLVLVPNSIDREPVLLPELLSLLLRSDLVYGQLVHKVMGIGRPRLNRVDVLSVKIPVPSKQDQRRLLELYRRSESAARTLQEESDKARQAADEMINQARNQLVRDLLANGQE